MFAPSYFPVSYFTGVYWPPGGDAFGPNPGPYRVAVREVLAGGRFAGQPWVPSPVCGVLLPGSVETEAWKPTGPVEVLTPGTTAKEIHDV